MQFPEFLWRRILPCGRGFVWTRVVHWLPVLLGVGIAMNQGAEPSDRAAVAVEALRRLKGVDLEANPALKRAVETILTSVKGTPQFVELVREFNVKGQEPALLELALKHPSDAAGVDALRLLLANGGLPLIQQTIESEHAGAMLQVLSNVPEKDCVPLLRSVAADARRSLDQRKTAIHALAQTFEGAEWLMTTATDPSFAGDLQRATSLELLGARWPEIRTKAAELFPKAAHAGTLLPAVADLVKLRGDAVRGAEVFGRETVGCIHCHQAGGRGTDFGPNLTEIGSKLAKEAIYDAILDPSAGISFGYEPWVVELRNGDEAYGLLASETADEVAIKAPTGIVTRYRKSEIVSKTMQKMSIMPAGLAETMSRRDLVDLIEYLSSLHKREPTGNAGSANLEGR